MNLNYLPLRFTSDVFKGGLLYFEGNPKDLSTKDSALSVKLRELRHQGAAAESVSWLSISCTIASMRAVRSSASVVRLSHSQPAIEMPS